MKDPGLDNFMFLFGLILALLILSGYCFYGNEIYENNMQMAYCLYESNWYKLPNDLAKMYIVMIANCQQPRFYHGFNIVNMEMETVTKVDFLYYFIDFIGFYHICKLIKFFKLFIQVLKVSISYYLAFKTISK